MPASTPIGMPTSAGEPDEDERADDGVGHAAAGLADRLGQLGEEAQVEPAEPLARTR